MPVAIGVKLGQKNLPTAICVVDSKWRRPSSAPGRESHFVVRHVERLPAGTSFPESAEVLDRLHTGARSKAGYRPRIFVDATGLGSPILELLSAKVGWIVGVYFNHGDRRLEDSSADEIRLGKAWLIARLQTLLQTQRLHLPKGKDFQSLAQDLCDYQIEVTPDANDRYGAFKVGSQDEVVTALGLAVQTDPPTPTRRHRYLCT